MADSTFDIVSKVDKMEADNAVNQAQKELATRYDFKGVGASVEWSGEKLLLKASAEERETRMRAPDVAGEDHGSDAKLGRRASLPRHET